MTNDRKWERHFMASPLPCKRVASLITRNNLDFETQPHHSDSCTAFICNHTQIMINMKSCWFICHCLWCTSGLCQWTMNFIKLENALDRHLKRKMGKYFDVMWQNTTLSILNKGGNLQDGSPCTVSVVLFLIFRVITPSSHISDPSCPGCSSCFISFPLPCGQEMAGDHGYTNSGGAGRKWSHCSTCNQEIEQPQAAYVHRDTYTNVHNPQTPSDFPYSCWH